jgi:hypothetical protein
MTTCVHGVEKRRKKDSGPTWNLSSEMTLTWYVEVANHPLVLKPGLEPHSTCLLWIVRNAQQTLRDPFWSAALTFITISSY